MPACPQPVEDRDAALIASVGASKPGAMDIEKS